MVSGQGRQLLLNKSPPRLHGFQGFDLMSRLSVSQGGILASVSEWNSLEKFEVEGVSCVAISLPRGYLAVF